MEVSPSESKFGKQGTFAGGINVLNGVLACVERAFRRWLGIEVVNDGTENRSHLHVGDKLPGTVLLIVREQHESTSI